MFFFVAWFVLIIQNFRVFFSVWVKFAIRYYYKSFYYFFLLFIYDCFLFCRCYFLDFLSFFSLLYFLLYLLSWEDLFIFFKFYFFICFFRICRIDTSGATTSILHGKHNSTVRFLRVAVHSSLKANISALLWNSIVLHAQWFCTKKKILTLIHTSHTCIPFGKKRSITG